MLLLQTVKAGSQVARFAFGKITEGQARPPMLTALVIDTHKACELYRNRGSGVRVWQWPKLFSTS